MGFVTLPDKILRAGNHTLIVMRDGAFCQAVCVLDDETIGDVRSKLPLIETLASRKVDRGELAFDGRVWITPGDLPKPLVC